MALCLPPDELWCFLRLALAFLGYPFLIHIISICLWEKRGYGYECYTWGYHAESKLVVIFACPSESIRPKQFFPMNSHTFEKVTQPRIEGSQRFMFRGSLTEGTEGTEGGFETRWARTRGRLRLRKMPNW